MAQPSGETIHTLPNQPVHLFQLNTDPNTYNNPMGCGAFSTAMALSCYNPRQYGTYDVAKFFFTRMLKVPGFGGTFESQNARIARLQGFKANSYDHGDVQQLTAAIDVGAPVILLINPGKFGIGTHDVLLVGYSADSANNPLALFIDNPWHAEDKQTDPSYPGNETITVAESQTKWTHVYTPVFSSDAQEAEWQNRTGRQAANGAS